MSRGAGHIDPALFVQYCDGELDGDQRVSLEAHIEHCGACRAELALAREYAGVAVGATLRGRSDALTSSFQERLQARLRSDDLAATPVVGPRTPAPRRRSPWLWRGLLAASVAVLALGIYQMQKPPTPSDLADLGRTLRTSAARARLTLAARAADTGGWQLDCQVDPALRDPFVVITTLDGEVALKRKLSGPRFSFQRSDLGPHAGAETLFAQIVAIDALGNPVRSKPEQLP